MNPEYRIRSAERADLPDILEIYNDALLHTHAHFFESPVNLEEREKWFSHHGPQHPVIVALQDQTIIAWASLSRWSAYPEFASSAEVSVYVHRDYRSRGIGKAMLKDLLERARGKGLHTIIARILEGNPGSIRIHEALGFKQTGIMKEIGRKWGKYLDLYILQYILD